MSVATEPDSTLVVQTKVDFPTLEGVLARLNWRLSSGPLAGPPIISGEPEIALWSRGDAHISYTFNPVVGLRILAFYGPRAITESAEVASIVPTMDLSDVRFLLAADDVRTVLLGVFAARELRLRETIDLITVLQYHPNETVSAAASQAQADIIASQFTTVIEDIQDEKRRHPERSVLFSRLGDADTRRQTLRWLIHDFPESNEHITEVLRSALVDADWEVRVTAMLAAAHFGARELLDDVQALDVTSAEHSDEDIFLALRASVVDELNRTPGTGGSNETSPNGEAPSGLSQNLHRLMRSVDERFSDRAQTLIPMLTLPLPEDEDADHG